MQATQNRRGGQRLNQLTTIEPRTGVLAFHHAYLTLPAADERPVNANSARSAPGFFPWFPEASEI